MAFSSEIKARVIARLLSGANKSAIALEFGVSKGTIDVWEAELEGGIAPQKIITQFDLARAARQEKFLQLVDEFVEATLRMNIEQAKVASDPEYIKKQNPSSLADLGQSITDRCVRILDASNGKRTSQPDRSVDVA